MKPAKPTQHEVDFVLSILDGKGWMTADEIGCAQSWMSRFSDHWNNKRRLRSIAQASCGLILSYPGSPGYKRTDQATVGEIKTASNKLRHQADEMMSRARQLDIAAAWSALGIDCNSNWPEGKPCLQTGSNV